MIVLTNRMIAYDQRMTAYEDRMMPYGDRMKNRMMYAQIVIRLPYDLHTVTIRQSLFFFLHLAQVIQSNCCIRLSLLSQTTTDADLDGCLRLDRRRSHSA
jgi:hypothetical protein